MGPGFFFFMLLDVGLYVGCIIYTHVLWFSSHMSGHIFFEGFGTKPTGARFLNSVGLLDYTSHPIFVSNTRLVQSTYSTLLSKHFHLNNKLCLLDILVKRRQSPAHEKWKWRELWICPRGVEYQYTRCIRPNHQHIFVSPQLGVYRKTCTHHVGWNSYLKDVWNICPPSIWRRRKSVRWPQALRGTFYIFHTHSFMMFVPESNSFSSYFHEKREEEMNNLDAHHST